MENFHIGLGEQIAFLVMVVLALGIHMYVIYMRLNTMLLAQEEDRFDSIPKRIGYAIRYALFQYRMPQEFLPGLLHILIFGTFLTVGLRTMMLMAKGVTGDIHFAFWVFGPTQPLGILYNFIKDWMALFAIVACFGFIWRRMINKPTRMQGLVVWEPVLILLWISGLMATEYGIESSEIFLMKQDGVNVAAWWAPISYAVSGLYHTADGAMLSYKINFWVHCAMILMFLNYLPFGKHFHIITSFPNVFLARTDSVGRLKPLLDMEERMEQMEEDENVVLGARDPEHLTWKHVLDVYTCTECGRCVPHCPAWVTQKPLSLRQVNKDVKKTILARAPYLLGTNQGPDGKEKTYEGDVMTAGVISSETIWACTMCRDCEQRCPLLIEQVSKIAEMRRYLVMIEGDVAPELNKCFRGWETKSNPWSLDPGTRGDWMKGLEDVPLLSDKPDAEYLLYLGCMASFDDRTIRVTKALIKILQAAGVSFAVLGEEEQCCGETARRLGNEFLGNTMVEANVEMLKEYGVKKIITNCPHCFNTLKNEYPDFGFAAEEVVHGQVLVNRLLKQGKIKLNKKSLGTIAYHDSCFLGRYNQIYEAPRNLLRSCGASVAEPENHHHESFCCGAGGGRMWLEEDEPRVNYTRFAEIMDSTGVMKGASEEKPAHVALSCPYCMTMLTDGSKLPDYDEKAKVRDVLEYVAEALD